ncbi:MAG TPA: hypothetical protein VJS43_18790 [Candidatus Acidoferrales bacterium]|nr:hypothetical protein [Candidatus Acidoferrales bacterium]
MKPINDRTQIDQYGVLLREMMSTEKRREYEFNPDWVRNRGWKVVPAESMARIPVPDIPRIVSTLRRAGYTECIAVFNEPGYIQHLPLIVAGDPPSGLATCHLVSLDEVDFQNFNRELGAFRSVLLPEDSSWAISCNEWYNLFGARPELLEALLGQPIEQARRQFAELAAAVAKGNADETLLKVAKHYAAL